jgi:hypothetical protein
VAARSAPCSAISADAHARDGTWPADLVCMSLLEKIVPEQVSLDSYSLSALLGGA